MALRWAVLLGLVVGCKGGKDDVPSVPACEPAPVPDIATRRFGFQRDGSFVGPGGRHIVPAGPSTVLEGMGGDLVLHPNGAWAYVTATRRYGRKLYVMDLERNRILQTVDRDELFHGLQITSDGSRLYASAGAKERVDVFDIGIDGLLTETANVPLTGWVGGIALSDDDQTLWAGQFSSGRIDEIDTTTLTVGRSIDIDTGVWELAYVPQRQELYAGELGGTVVAVVDLAQGRQVDEVDAASPAGFAVSDDGKTVWVAESEGDRVSAIDTRSHRVIRQADVGGDLLRDGVPLPHSNVNGLWYDPGEDQLFATRGVDNAVSVLDARTLDTLGAIPTAFYPTAVQLASDGRTLVVTELKGGGVGPGGGAKDLQKGSVTTIDLGRLNLARATDEAVTNFMSPLERHPYPCAEGTHFPIPEGYDGNSPIHHVILVVKENKTFDCLFGDMGDELGVDADPAYLEWDASLTPNQRALLKQFNVSDNFYTESHDSDSGHIFLTSGHWTEFTERLWWEFDRSGFFGWQVTDPVMPVEGNFFTHLLDHGKTIRVYGEVVGMNLPTDGPQPIEFADLNYPGGPIINYAVPDEEKAKYVVQRAQTEGLADFTFLSFPNDHTVGTNPGAPTPESMVADNDIAVGLLVEGISADPALWARTVIFVVEDDPQGCGDHVDATRSFVTVISPFAKRGYVSHVNAAYLSVFATIERILAVPPKGRPSAGAAPLWDFFQAEADMTPFTHIPRVPPTMNGRSAFAADLSQDLDLAGPDRDPRLSGLLHAYRQWKLGRITRAEAEALLETERMGIEEDRWEELEEEAEEEIFAFDHAWRQYVRWAVDQGHPRPERPKIPGAP